MLLNSFEALCLNEPLSFYKEKNLLLLWYYENHPVSREDTLLMKIFLEKSNFLLKVHELNPCFLFGEM
jgi:hypothetical protein